MYKVGYVDDEGIEAMLFMEMNKDLPMEVITTTDFEEILEYDLDFVFMDLFLGLIAPSPLERAKILTDKGIPFAFVSGADEDYFNEMVEELDFPCNFYNKPISTEDVRRLLENECKR